MTSGDAEEGPVINANPQTNGSQCFLGEWWSACPHSSHFSLEGLGGGKAADTESYMSLMTACRGCIIKQVQDKWCIVILIINKNLHEVSILSFHFNAIWTIFRHSPAWNPLRRNVFPSFSFLVLREIWSKSGKDLNVLLQSSTHVTWSHFNSRPENNNGLTTAESGSELFLSLNLGGRRKVCNVSVKLFLSNSGH